MAKDFQYEYAKRALLKVCMTLNSELDAETLDKIDAALRNPLGRGPTYEDRETYTILAVYFRWT